MIIIITVRDACPAPPNYALLLIFWFSLPCLADFHPRTLPRPTEKWSSLIMAMMTLIEILIMIIVPKWCRRE